MHKILIVEDDEDVLELLRSFFPMDEFITYPENDSHKACSTFDRFKPDLVLADVVMPGTDGFKLIEHIAKSESSPIVFMVTGFDFVKGEDLYNRNVHLFLRKPISGREIYAAAKRFLKDKPTHSFSENLSPREREIIALVTQGQTTKEIGEQLKISSKTVAKHRENMLRRFNAKNIVDLVVKVTRISH